MRTHAMNALSFMWSWVIPAVVAHQPSCLIREWRRHDAIGHWCKPRSQNAYAIACDRSGLGRSPPDVQPRSVARMADDLNDLLDHLGSPSYLLVGHSAGGPIIRAAAASRPERVSGLPHRHSILSTSRTKLPIKRWRCTTQTSTGV